MKSLAPALLLLSPLVWAQNTPVITLVANAEGEVPVIAPNTWVEVKGQNLSRADDSRIWQGSDFVNNQLPTTLDGVSVTVNGKSAYVYYISPTQINILTPPDAMQGSVTVVVTNNGAISAPFTAQAQPLSPSFFRVQRRTLRCGDARRWQPIWDRPVSFPGRTTPAKPGEVVCLRQRFRADLDAGGQRVPGAIGKPVAVAGGDDRRNSGRRAICGAGCARGVSVQRSCSAQCAERRQRGGCTDQRRGRWTCGG